MSTLRIDRTFWRAFPGILLAGVFLTTAASTQAQSDPVGETIRLVNEVRTSRSLPPFQVNTVLMQVAQAQASWSAANNHIGHDGPGGSSPNDRAQAAGYGAGFQSYATENAAHGSVEYHTPQLVVSKWQGDPIHLDALISTKYEHIGVGYAAANGFSWYVLMAGWVAGDGPVSAAAAPAATATSAAIAENSIFAPPVATSEAGEDGAIYHEVLSGQANWTIAARYGLTVEQLYELNSLTADSIIHPGDRLLIRPANTATPTETPPPSAAATVAPPSSTPGPPPSESSKLALADLPTPTPATTGSPSLADGQDTTTRRTTPPMILLLAAGALLLLLVLVIALAMTSRP